MVYHMLCTYLYGRVVIYLVIIIIILSMPSNNCTTTDRYSFSLSEFDRCKMQDARRKSSVSETLAIIIAHVPHHIIHRHLKNLRGERQIKSHAHFFPHHLQLGSI